MPATPKRANKEPRRGAVFLSQVVARNIRDVRALRRMSQEAVATRMRNLGHDTWSRATVSEIERNGRAVSIDETLSLALVLGIEVPTLLDPAGVTGRPQANLDYGAGVMSAESASKWVRGHALLRLHDDLTLSVEADLRFMANLNEDEGRTES